MQLREEALGFCTRRRANGRPRAHVAKHTATKKKEPLRVADERGGSARARGRRLLVQKEKASRAPRSPFWQAAEGRPPRKKGPPPGRAGGARARVLDEFCRENASCSRARQSRAGFT